MSLILNCTLKILCFWNQKSNKQDTNQELTLTLLMRNQLPFSLLTVISHLIAFKLPHKCSFHLVFTQDYFCPFFLSWISSFYVARLVIFKVLLTCKAPRCKAFLARKNAILSRRSPRLDWNCLSTLFSSASNFFTPSDFEVIELKARIRLFESRSNEAQMCDVRFISIIGFLLLVFQGFWLQINDNKLDRWTP